MMRTDFRSIALIAGMAVVTALTGAPSPEVPGPLLHAPGTTNPAAPATGPSVLPAAGEEPALPMPQRLVPLGSAVYPLLDYYELAGYTGYLPQSRPYTRQLVYDLLRGVLTDEYLPRRERDVVQRMVDDLLQEAHGVVMKRSGSADNTTLIGVAARAGVRGGAGDGGSWTTVNIAEPYIAGALGKNLSYLAGIGLSLERHAADIFYQSYVKDGRVHFPNEGVGYSWHPYQFQYPTMWNHVSASVTTGGGPPVQEALTAGMLYHAELSGVWINGKLQLHYHNHYRSWGYRSDNLFLSERARRFPGLDLTITPAHWLRYSWVTGSLFAYANQWSNYKANIYGYDLGHPQKMFSLHQLEVNFTSKLQATFIGGNIWSKRFEPAYLMPFVLPHLAQIDVGDHDNLSVGASLAWLCSCSGKFHASLFIDEFSFLDDGPLLRLPRNRYAWQVGWSRQVPAAIVPLTTFELTVTRVGPFVYTHYPEDFISFSGGRPVDHTYTHDEATLGFYLPPNAGELQLQLTTLAVPDLLLAFDNRLMVHGTNDLAGDQYRIFGDVYRHQYGLINNYPLMDFMKDGIYDYTWFSELSFGKTIRQAGLTESFRLVGSLGFSRTWWKGNNSGVEVPETERLFTGSLGVVVDF